MFVIVASAQLVKGESAFHAGFVMQFFALLCTRMMRLCRSVHKDFVHATCYKEAFAIVRSKLPDDEPSSPSATSKVDQVAGCVNLPCPLQVFRMTFMCLDDPHVPLLRFFL